MLYSASCWKGCIAESRERLCVPALLDCVFISNMYARRYLHPGERMPGRTACLWERMSLSIQMSVSCILILCFPSVVIV